MTLPIFGELTITTVAPFAIRLDVKSVADQGCSSPPYLFNMSPLTKEEQRKLELKEYTERYTGNNTCIRPDICAHEDNCGSCIYYAYCLCKSRKLTKADKKIAIEREQGQEKDNVVKENA